MMKKEAFFFLFFFRFFGRLDIGKCQPRTCIEKIDFILNLNFLPVARGRMKYFLGNFAAMETLIFKVVEKKLLIGLDVFESIYGFIGSIKRL